MKRHLFSTLTFIFIVLSSFGQVRDTIPVIGLSIISQVNQGNSYITFPTDIGNIEPLMFEGNLIPNFHLRHNKNYRLLGVLTPQVILRMYRQRSYPILNPSYIPQFTLYYMLSAKEASKNISLFGRLAHHSNGQDGTFFLENGDINLKTGDFSTNFIEAGCIATNFNTRINAYQFFKTSVEVHPLSWGSDELEGIYSKYRWHNTFSIFKLPANNNRITKDKADFSMKGEATWMFGKFNNWKGTSLNRFNLSLTVSYLPEFLEDIGLFVQFYHGLDYYNMYFNHQLNMVRFGLITEKLRF